jgi:hypothetical protein
MMGRGMRILLIPGFMQGAGAWAPVAALLEAEHEVTALEHLEHTYEGRWRRSPQRARARRSADTRWAGAWR